MRQILEPRHASTSTATNEKQLRVDNRAASNLILYTHYPTSLQYIHLHPFQLLLQPGIDSQAPLFPLRARQIKETMATTFASAAVAIPSFTGLKAETPKVVFAKQCSSGSAGAVKAGAIKASLKDVSVAAAAAAASLVLASNAMAIDVKLGSDDGGLVFEPREFSVPAGEKITFKNNAGFPHNVVFDEDEVPDGVDAGAISMPEDALLNGPGETFDVTLLTKGVYSFYCAPHQGAGMVGKVVVN